MKHKTGIERVNSINFDGSKITSSSILLDIYERARLKRQRKKTNEALKTENSFSLSTICLLRTCFSFSLKSCAKMTIDDS